ncbi:MAG: dUTP diphosphatase, partial [Gemmatimonadales bacterium]
ELCIALINLGTEPFEVTRGMRIGQLVIARVEGARFEEVAELPPTGRGAVGFGSTGS